MRVPKHFKWSRVQSPVRIRGSHRQTPPSRPCLRRPEFPLRSRRCLGGRSTSRSPIRLRWSTRSRRATGKCRRFDPGREKKIVFISSRIFFISSLSPVFLLLVLQLHFRADRLPMIGARQPSGLNYWSLPTAAYPTRGRSKHNRGCGLKMNEMVSREKS